MSQIDHAYLASPYYDETSLPENLEYSDCQSYSSQNSQYTNQDNRKDSEVDETIIHFSSNTQKIPKQDDNNHCLETKSTGFMTMPSTNPQEKNEINENKNTVQNSFTQCQKQNNQNSIQNEIKNSKNIVQNSFNQLQKQNNQNPIQNEIKENNNIVQNSFNQFQKNDNHFPIQNEINKNENIITNSFNQINKEDNQKFLGKKKQKDDEKKANTGRKKKDSKEIGNHTKYDDDNIYAKIKIFIINSAKDLANMNFTHENNTVEKKEFLKLIKGENKSIKKESNLELLNTKLKDIFNHKISTKFTNFKENHNIILIKEIYEKKIEINVIQILELKFGELLNIFRGTISQELQEKISHINNINKFRRLEDLLKKIEQEEKKNGGSEENTKKYIDKIKKRCMDYEEWFNNKKSRSIKKKAENK